MVSGYFFSGSVFTTALRQASAVMYSMRSRENDVAGAASTSPSLSALTYRAFWTIRGRTLLAYLLRNMSLSKQARKPTFQESWEKYFCCAQDDNVRCLLCSIVQKGTHKWNIKWHYDTVLCSKSAADASNLSIFTLRYVHCGLRCATSSWDHISTWLPMPALRYYKEEGLVRKILITTYCYRKWDIDSNV